MHCKGFSALWYRKYLYLRKHTKEQFYQTTQTNKVKVWRILQKNKQLVKK